MSKSLQRVSTMRLGVEYPESASYPTIYVDNKQMPEIDKWEVGESYLLQVKVTVRSYDRRPGTNPSADIDLIKYKVLSEEPTKAYKHMM